MSKKYALRNAGTVLHALAFCQFEQKSKARFVQDDNNWRQNVRSFPQPSAGDCELPKLKDDGYLPCQSHANRRLKVSTWNRVKLQLYVTLRRL